MSGSDVRVAVVVDRIGDYQIPLIRGVQSVLHRAGAALVVAVSHPDFVWRDEVFAGLVGSGQVQGVICTGMSDAYAHRDRLSDIAAICADVPLVTLGKQAPGVPVVLAGNETGVREAMAHLLDECGRTRPLLVAGTRDSDDSQERVRAYFQVAAERHLVLPATPVVYGHFVQQSAREEMMAILEAGCDFDAVLAANDDMAFGVLEALRRHRLRVPEDVAVIGFDNTDQSYLSDPPLTSVDIDLQEQGRMAARLLLARIAGEQVAEVSRPVATLVVRRSSVSGSGGPLPVGTSISEAVPGRPGAAATGQAGVERALAVLGTLPALTERLDKNFSGRLEAMLREGVPLLLTGELPQPRASALHLELIQLVQAHPEPYWWYDLIALVQAAFAAAAPDGRLTVEHENTVLAMTSEIETALVAVREQRDRSVLALSDTVLGLNQNLSRCSSLEELTGEMSAYLARLNTRRCFVVLLDQHLPVPVATEGPPPVVPAGSVASSHELLARVVMSHRAGAPDTERENPENPMFGLERLLPPSLAEELTGGTLTLQPLFTTERWFGILLHEQTVIDRHTGEALRLDASRVLDGISRARELTERASELEALVRERTEQLELEAASRRAAQEGLHEANLELRRALLMDGLTGLQNRPSFDQHLIQAWHQHERSREPLSVLMIDVDHFKRYNDTYGHLAGDTCLRQVANCLQVAVTRKQDLVARYGGEEFSVILPDTDAEGAMLVADRLLRGVRAAAIPHIASEHQQVSVSIGIASAAPGVTSLEQLLHQADQALYVAKRNGRDRAESYT